MRRIARTMGICLAGLVLALGPAAPALAHGEDAPAATNYRTEVTGITAPADALTVRVVDGGYRLRLRNDGSEPVEVLGYEGEPFLLLRPDGAYENARSPTPYVNATGDPARVPESADPSAPPDWRKLADAPVAVWHDHRASRPATAPPPASATPGERQLVAEWAVPLRVGGAPAEITGTVEWLPPPAPGTWWAVTLLGAAVLATLGRLGPHRFVLAAGALSGAAVALAYAVARQLDAGAAHPGQVLAGLATGSLWAVLAALGAIATGAYAVWRETGERAAREPADGADFALALAGACLALFAGVAHAVVFARSVAPVPVDPLWARVAVSVVIVTGAGVAAAAVLRLRTARASARPDRS